MSETAKKPVRPTGNNPNAKRDRVTGDHVIDGLLMSYWKPTGTHNSPEPYEAMRKHVIGALKKAGLILYKATFDTKEPTKFQLAKKTRKFSLILEGNSIAVRDDATIIKQELVYFIKQVGPDTVYRTEGFDHVLRYYLDLEATKSATPTPRPASRPKTTK